jgi:hypothetical protein
VSIPCLRVDEIASKVGIFRLLANSSELGNPPPMFTIFSGVKSRSTADLNISRDYFKPVRYVVASPHPLPTWNDTPLILIPSFFAVFNSSGACYGSIPHFELNGLIELQSYTASRSNTAIFDLMSAILCSSSSESTTVSPTFCRSAN